MKILVIGAGVLGSLYAARLQASGQKVTLLARGARAEEVRRYGLVVEDAGTGQRSVARAGVVEALQPGDAYDWVIVFVRKNQLKELLPILAANRSTPNVLFMLNNVSGSGEMVNVLGRKRVLVGFPGAGGKRSGPVVRYRQLSSLVQSTTLGELDGKLSPRLRQIAGAFEAAGFPVDLSRRIDAWLKTHAALVSPIASALYLSGGDNYRLAHTPDGLILLVRAIREGFRVLAALGIPVTPARLRLIDWLPEPFLVWFFGRILDTRWAELVLAQHANAARDEMRAIAEEFRSLSRSTWVQTPALNTLSRYIDPAAPTLPAGTARLPLHWQALWVWTGALFSLFLLSRRKKRTRAIGLSA